MSKKIVTVDVENGDEFLPVWMSALDCGLVDEFILVREGREAAKLVRLDAHPPVSEFRKGIRRDDTTSG